ncbi:hypothetical protein [Desulfosediminicola flagellatus]|uniref:hypothetical protein n=1 Tax=Desulfosediminicola flagellatus TaxID=2569541 RepID=UPI0010ABE2A4|nr:hypothetical protein [Desulfosediminicola flagellatus]
MKMTQEFDSLMEKLKTQRDEIKLKIHLGSMEVRQEFEDAENTWQNVKLKASEITDDAVETSEEYVGKAKVVGEELKEAYNRITQRLSK